MKKKIFCLFALISSGYFAVSQNNLVTNPGFELGIAVPTYTPTSCNYPDSKNGADDFDSDMQGSWFTARHNNDKGFDVPDLIDLKFCTIFYSEQCGNIIPDQFTLPSKRFVFLDSPQQDDKNKYWHGGIRSELVGNQSLIPGRRYTIRYKILVIQKNDGKNFAHMRVHFTKWSVHWDSNSNNNQKFEALNANFIRTESANNCIWESVERHFVAPAGKNELRNIIFYSEAGGFMLDDIELFESCPTDEVFSNKIFDGHFYDSNAFEGNSFVASASNSITTQNSVEVQPGADVTFQAGVQVVLNPGFIAQPGSNFVAEIAPCQNMRYDIGMPSAPIEEGLAKELKGVEIFPNPSRGEFILTLADDKALMNKVEIRDVLGNKVLNTGVLPSGSTIDLSGRTSGIYFIRVESGDTIFSEKVVIQ